MKVSEIYDKFIIKRDAYESERVRIENKIELRKAQIARLEKKREKLVCPFWGTEIVKPIAEEIAKQTGFILDNDEKYNTFGMLAHCPASLKNNKGKTVKYLDFVPESLWDGTELKISLLDYNNDNSKPNNTIASLNHYYCPRVAISPDMDVLEIAELV